jgi:hypothetical protein
VVRKRERGSTKPLSLGGNLRFARRVMGSSNPETCFPGMPSSIRSLYSFIMWGDQSSSEIDDNEPVGGVVVDAVEGVGRSQEEEDGTARPAVRKNRRGEAKESNVDAGVLNKLLFRGWRVVASHPSSQACLLCHPSSVSGGGWVDSEGVSEVEMAVQSKIASRTMRPEIVVGTCFEAKLSVKAREVARVPPRKEP